jgi:hypothetical protein
MEIQELMQIWKTADEQLEKGVTINRKLLKEVSAQKVRSFFTDFKWSSIIELGVNAVFMLFLLSFSVNHFSDFKYLAPAILLLLTTLFSLALSSYKLLLLRRIDAQASVVQTQKNIEKIKYTNGLEKNMLYVLIPVFSITFLIVIAKAFFNYDLYRLGDYLLYYTAGSFIVGLIVVYLLKKFPDKNIQKSIAFLEQIKEYEQER